jgi:hypothetical protein
VRKIRKLSLESVISTPGIIPHETRLQQLRSHAYDAVVLSSVDLEGIPVALIEAMAAGIPCIATRTGAVGGAHRLQLRGSREPARPRRNERSNREACIRSLASQRNRRAGKASGCRSVRSWSLSAQTFMADDQYTMSQKVKLNQPHSDYVFGL